MTARYVSLIGRPAGALLAAVVLCSAAFPAGAGERLRYRWGPGNTRQCRIQVSGSGHVRTPEGTQPFRLDGKMETTERVARVGAGGVATLETTWDKAEFQIHGQQGSLAPGEAVCERRITPWGTVQAVRTRGRAKAARRGAGFAIDTDQLVLIDLLVEQLQWPVLPRHEVDEGQTWRTEEALPLEELKAQQERDTRLVRFVADGEKLLAELHIDLRASLSLELGEIGSLAGKATGTGTQMFRCRGGELDRATGTFKLELIAMPSEDQPPAAEAGADAEGLFGLFAEFAIEVSYEDTPPQE